MKKACMTDNMYAHKIVAIIHMVHIIRSLFEFIMFVVIRKYINNTGTHIIIMVLK